MYAHSCGCTAYGEDAMAVFLSIIIACSIAGDLHQCGPQITKYCD